MTNGPRRKSVKPTRGTPAAARRPAAPTIPPETEAVAEPEAAALAQETAAPEETGAVLYARDAGEVTAQAADPAASDEGPVSEPETVEAPETVLTRDRAEESLPPIETPAVETPAVMAEAPGEPLTSEPLTSGPLAHASVAAPEAVAEAVTASAEPVMQATMAAPAEAAAPPAPEPAAALTTLIRAAAEGAPEDVPVSALRGVAEINARLLAFMRDETEAAFSFWRALRNASNPGEAMQLHAEEVGRIVTAAFACWSDVTRRAALIALASRPKAA
ncbi:MAG: phasin family protein [Methylobacterium sp.]|uniref:phasin family protein n=1 Tax=Methylobacterium sp. TaxID=409 RepID=UPI00258779E4|nr:phasin family protein [Methylobacterium sp.]MBY0298167.1 phasin family protein [Methylobacterium sp.]